MEEVDNLLDRAERYRRMMAGVTDEIALHAMLAMAEDLEKRALESDERENFSRHRI